MRVTQSMLNSQLLRNLNNNLGRLNVLQDQLATGRKINKPSDDPVGISYSLRYRSELNANDQYQRNNSSVTSWLEAYDKSISEVNSVLQRARELAVQGANSTNPDQAMQAIAQEVDELYEHLVQVGNSKFNGKYIFNGQKTDIEPYASGTAETTSTDSGLIKLEVSTGVTLQVNVTGTELFGAGSDPTNAFQVLSNLKTALNANDHSAVSSMLGQIDQRMDNILVKWAEVGARANRIELITNRLLDESINVQSLLSRTEDADVAELMVNLKTQENVYQASLSTGAQIIRPSLVDFMR